MSGTSLDGIDLAHIVFYGMQQKWDFKILETANHPSTEWLNKLKTAYRFPKRFEPLNKGTQLLATIINDFKLKNS
jgi:anhydro-N-acetylmuramic acid kinase